METLPYYEEINGIYDRLLGRKVDYDGFCTYSVLFEKGKMNERKLENILKNSNEYKKREVGGEEETEAEGEEAFNGIKRETNVVWDVIGAYKTDKKDIKETLLKRKYEKSGSDSLFSVVITNWKRTEFLKRCFESIVKCGIKNIIISCSSLSREGLVVLKEIMDKHRHVKVVATEGDLGVNQLWLQGLYYVNTPYVLIMHDDDEMCNLMEDYLVKIENILDTDVELLWWDGLILETDEDGDAELTHEYHSNWNRNSGYYKTQEYLEDYKKAVYPVSPVVQILKTKTCIDVLSECKSNFRSNEHFSKPTMMLGNEIMLTLRTLENKNKDIYYLNKPLTLYGRHSGSESEIYVQNEDNTLKKGYSAARNYFLENPNYGIVNEGNLIHLVSMFSPKCENDERRHLYAMNNWYRFYEKGVITPRFIYDNEFTRMSKDVGDKRNMPFIKDIIDIGFENLRDEDVIVLTNSDISFTTDAFKYIKKYTKKYGCCFAFRYDSQQMIEDETWYSSHELDAYFDWYVGSDVFAITKAWWKRWGPMYPDLLIGKPNWDWIMRSLMGYSIIGDKVWNQSLDTIGNIANCGSIIYHEKHESYAELKDLYFNDKANLWNWKIAYEWFKEISNGKVDGMDIFENIKNKHMNYIGWNGYISYAKRFWHLFK